MVKPLEFLDVTTLDTDRLMQVLKIRNEPRIRENMYTDHVIQPDEHLAWIESLKATDRTVFFAVVFEGSIIGGVSLSGIDRKHKRADWAFYLSETAQGKGLGSALERQFVTKAFDEFGIEKLNCEVISFNEKVIAMHQRFGFKKEGSRREHVIRNGRKYDAVLLGVTKGEWLNGISR